jgi:hypothetical protein
MGVLCERVKYTLRQCMNSSEDLLESLQNNPDHIMYVDEVEVHEAISYLQKVLDLKRNSLERGND